MVDFSALESQVNAVAVAVLGESVVWNGFTLSGKFDQSYFEPLSMMESTKPALTVIASDFVGVKRGDVVVVRSINYKVTTIQPDGRGMLVLPLELV